MNTLPSIDLFNLDTSLLKREYTTIQKLIKTRSVFPNILELEALGDALDLKPQKKYNDLTIRTVMDLSPFVHSIHNLHELDGNIAVSNTYIHKISPHSTNIVKMFYKLFTVAHKGNKFDGNGCSSYKLNKNLRGIVDEVVYTYEQDVFDAIENYMHTKDRQAYIQAYEKAKKKECIVQPKSNKDKIISKILNKHNISEGVKPIIKSFIMSGRMLKNIDDAYIYIQDRLDNLKDYGKDTYIYDEELEIKYVSKPKDKRVLFIKRSYNKILNEIKALKRQIDGNELIYDVSVSELSSRNFHILNRMSKYLRRLIFKNYIDLDVKNMAFVSIRNAYPDLYMPYSDMYIHNRDDVLKEISDEVWLVVKYMQSGNTLSKDEVNRKTDLYKSIKIFVKLNLLSFLFGSNKHVLYDKNQYEIVTAMNALINIDSYSSNMLKGLLDEIKTAFKGKEKNHLANLFMNIETKIRTEITQVFVEFNPLLKNRIVDIHDGILVPDIEYSNEVFNKLNNITKSFKISIPNIKELRISTSKEIRNVINQLKITSKKFESLLVHNIYSFKHVLELLYKEGFGIHEYSNSVSLNNIKVMKNYNLNTT